MFYSSFGDRSARVFLAVFDAMQEHHDMRMESQALFALQEAAETWDAIVFSLVFVDHRPNSGEMTPRK